MVYLETSRSRSLNPTSFYKTIPSGLPGAPLRGRDPGRGGLAHVGVALLGRRNKNNMIIILAVVILIIIIIIIIIVIIVIVIVITILLLIIMQTIIMKPAESWKGAAAAAQGFESNHSSAEQ